VKTSLDHDHIIFNQWAPSRIARNSKVLAALGPTGQPRASDSCDFSQIVATNDGRRLASGAPHIAEPLRLRQSGKRMTGAVLHRELLTAPKSREPPGGCFELQKRGGEEKGSHSNPRRLKFPSTLAQAPTHGHRACAVKVRPSGPGSGSKPRQAAAERYACLVVRFRHVAS
jgi:hypothetical protein